MVPAPINFSAGSFQEVLADDLFQYSGGVSEKFLQDFCEGVRVGRDGLDIEVEADRFPYIDSEGFEECLFDGSLDKLVECALRQGSGLSKGLVEVFGAIEASGGRAGGGLKYSRDLIPTNVAKANIDSMWRKSPSMP